MILMIVAEMAQGAFMVIGTFNKQGSRNVTLFFMQKRTTPKSGSN